MKRLRKRNINGRAAARAAAAAAAAATVLALAAAAQQPAFAQGGFRGGGYSQGGFNRGNEEIAKSGGWEARLRTDRTQYQPGRGVELTVMLTNVGNRRQQIIADGRSQEYTLTVRDARSNRIVWNASRKLSGITLNPGETRLNREFWDQRGTDGRRVPSGSYRVEARVHPGLVMNTTIFLQDSGGGRDEDTPGRPGFPNRPPVPPGRPGIPGDLNPPGGGGGGAFPGRPGFPGGGGNTNRDVRAVVRPDRTTVRPGDRVGFNFTVENSSRMRQNYRFSSGRQYDVEVRDSRGRLVWQYTQNMRFLQALTEFSLDPGQSKNFFANWTVDRDLPRGTYTVVAYLPTTLGQVGEARSRITVE